jgi:hypothetical protein
MESNAQRAVEIDVGNAQVSDLLHPCPGVIEDHKDTAIAKGKVSMAWQRFEQSFDFVVIQVISLRGRGAFHRYRLHTLSFGQHLGILEAEISVERMKGG